VEITRQADYAVRTVLDLAIHSDEERISSEEIARRQTIPAAFLTKIIARLAAADLVQTQRGVNGGIRLARSAGEITLLQVVEAIDGPIAFNRCNRSPSECARNRTCAVHPIWLELCEEFRARLSSYHFAAIADRARGTTPLNRLAIPLLEGLPVAQVKVKK
jgi:Rrf2 family protein